MIKASIILIFLYSLLFSNDSTYNYHNKPRQNKNYVSLNALLSDTNGIGNSSKREDYLDYCLDVKSKIDSTLDSVCKKIKGLEIILKIDNKGKVLDVSAKNKMADKNVKSQIEEQIKLLDFGTFPSLIVENVLTIRIIFDKHKIIIL